MAFCNRSGASRTLFVAAFVAGLLGAGAAHAADPQIASFVDNPDPVAAGGNVTYTARVSNNAVDDAANVSLAVPVLTALDNAGGVYEAILPSLAAIEVALDGRIAAGSVVCSDGTTAYVKAAVTAGAEYRRVVVPTITPMAVKVAPVPTKRRQKSRLGLGRVNAHLGQIKGLVNGRCRGVATRYLGN